MAGRKTKLVGIEEAAQLFGKSVHQMREYKSKVCLRLQTVTVTRICMTWRR